MDLSSADWKDKAFSNAGTIRSHRRYLHARPELGNREFGTASYIENVLHSLGIGTRRLLGTAVIGELKGISDKPLIALRSDIDALPLFEETGCSFASLNSGVMHACGHDVHMSAALGCAMLLGSLRDSLPGSVRFIFQPDEEGDGGGRRLVECGVMEGVDAAFGMHVDPNLPYGTVGVRYGKFYAASDKFHITIKGRSSHAARPEEGIDALYAAASIITRMHELPAETLPDKTVVSTCQITSGKALNILSDYARFEGIIRTLGPENRKHIHDGVYRIIDETNAALGTSSEVSIECSHEGIVNTDRETASAEGSAVRIFGRDKVVRIPEATMLSEDFGFFVDAASGSYYHLGVGGDYGLHNTRFFPPEDAPVIGAALHAAVITGYMVEKGKCNNA